MTLFTLNENTMNNLKKQYADTIFNELKTNLTIENPMRVPKLVKICINTGISEATDANVKEASQNLTVITGQKAVITRAKKAVSNFKIRKGDIVGCKVTLRKKKMYDFMQRLIHIAIPAIRDFQGISTRGFDGRGNYSLGIQEMIIFPEINPDTIQYNHGIDINIVTSAENDEHAKALLTMFGMPFRQGA